MKKILVLCKGTGQSTAFKKAAVEYVEKESLAIEWLFADDTSYDNHVKEGVDYVVISPEMMLVEAKVKKDLDSQGVNYFSVKPADFGLRRIDTILKSMNING